MSRLHILHHPDPRLRTKAKAITEFSPEVATLAANMLETMYDAPGIGLAATQVNVHQRLIVVDVSEDNDEPFILINPTLKLIGANIPWEEGCLSVLKEVVVAGMPVCNGSHTPVGIGSHTKIPGGRAGAGGGVAAADAAVPRACTRAAPRWLLQQPRCCKAAKLLSRPDTILA